MNGLTLPGSAGFAAAHPGPARGSDRRSQPSADADPCTRGLLARSVYKNPSVLHPGGAAVRGWRAMALRVSAGDSVWHCPGCGGDSTGQVGQKGEWKRRAGQVENLDNTGMLLTVLLLCVRPRPLQN